MTRRILLPIQAPTKIYQEVTTALCPHRAKPRGSLMFIVEGTLKNPLIGLRYPGRKLKKRKLQQIRKDSALWANLYDFEVVAYENGEEVTSNKFTFSTLMEDFYRNKKRGRKFWRCIEEIYYNNTLSQEPPHTNGINSRMFLLLLKWIWVQEDFNYRFDWQEVGSPIKYIRENRTGTRTAKGAGRAKFFAALLLLNYFTLDQVKKIIPFY